MAFGRSMRIVARRTGSEKPLMPDSRFRSNGVKPYRSLKIAQKSFLPELSRWGWFPVWRRWSVCRSPGRPERECARRIAPSAPSVQLARSSFSTPGAGNVSIDIQAGQPERLRPLGTVTGTRHAKPASVNTNASSALVRLAGWREVEDQRKNLCPENPQSGLRHMVAHEGC